MRSMRVPLDKTGNWFAPKKRRRITVTAIVTLAAVVSALLTINGYGIESTEPPTAPLAWFATSSLGAHEVDPQYSQACDTHDRYYPIGALIDQSGWPVNFEYDIFTAHYNCLGVFYPVPFMIDVALFAAVYAVLLLVVPQIVAKLCHNKLITRKRIIIGVAACIAPVFVTYETAYFIRISGPDAQAPPLASAVTTFSYAKPINFPLCPSSNTTVEKKICQSQELCALTGISEPSDPRYATRGWPLAYTYSSLDPCFGDTIYPLIFLVDTIYYAVILVTIGLVVRRVWLHKLQPA